MLRTYKYIITHSNSENGTRALLESNANCPSFANFLSNFIETNRCLKSPPSPDELDEVLKQAGDVLESYDKEATHSLDDIQDPIPFSLSEFSRLVVIIKYDETCKQAMEKLQLELTRGEIDGGRTRDFYWGVIAQRFNDTSLRPSMSFLGCCEEADPSRLPLNYRPASVLKLQFQNARSHFTTAKKRWEVSGQNDPQRFWRFVHCKNQDPHTPTTIGKRCLILSRVSELGTPAVDTFFLNVSSKEMNVGGYEEGVTASVPAIIVDDPVVSDRKKRRVSNESHTNSALSEMTGLVGKLVEQDRLMVNRMTSAGAPDSRNTNNGQEDDREVRMKRMERMSRCIKLMEDLKSSCRLAIERKEDDEYISFLNSHYKLLREEYDELHLQK